MKSKLETTVCGESERKNSGSDLVPIPAAGIGTRIGEVANLIGTRESAYTKMGVSSATLQRYIKEDVSPPFDAIARLCLAAGVRMEWLATGEGEMLASATAKAAEPAPGLASHGARPPDAQMELGLLTIAVRIVGEVLDGAGIRAQTDTDQYGELVRLVFNDLARGAAEDGARDALDRILSIARSPHGN